MSHLPDEPTGLPELPHTGFVADEVGTLLGFLDFYRVTLERQTYGLDGEALAATLPPSDLTLGALLKHMANVENSWFTRVEGGARDEPWASVDWEGDPDWDLRSAAEDSPEELRGLLRTEIERSRTVVDRALGRPEGLDAVAVRPWRGHHVTLRWILVHMIEEYARHCGHADLVRQSVDGAVDL